MDFKPPAEDENIQDTRIQIYLHEKYLYCCKLVKDLYHNRLQLFDSSLISHDLAQNLGTALQLIISSRKKQEYLSSYLHEIYEYLNYKPLNSTIPESDKFQLLAQSISFIKDTCASSIKYFIFICLILILSGTAVAMPKVLEFDISHIETRYGSWERQYVRILSISLFNIQDETECEGTGCYNEWSLVLLIEHCIAAEINRQMRLVTGRSVDTSKIIDESFFGYNYIKRKVEVTSNPNQIADPLSPCPKEVKLKFQLRDAHEGLSYTRNLVPPVPIKVHMIDLECLKTTPSLHNTILITGWLTQDENMAEYWSSLLTYPTQSRTYAFKWEASSYKRVLKEDMNDLLTICAGYLTNPIINFFTLFNIFRAHPYRRAAKRAKLSGRILANLLEQTLLGKSAVTLVAFSLGTRVVYHCLQKLASIDRQIVHDVYLLGGAAPIRPERWQLCRKAVSGRIVNAFSRDDQIISVFFKMINFENAIGSGPIPVDGVENYDVTHICDGHYVYREKLDEVLRFIKYSG